jgi:hypothetical protein
VLIVVPDILRIAVRNSGLNVVVLLLLKVLGGVNRKKEKGRGRGRRQGGARRGFVAGVSILRTRRTK